MDTDLYRHLAQEGIQRSNKQRNMCKSAIVIPEVQDKVTIV